MDANLSSRLVTAAVGIPLLVGFVGWSPPWLFSTFFFILVLEALREYFTIVFPSDWRERWMGIIFGLCLSGAVFLDSSVDPLVWLNIVLLIAFSLYLFAGGQLADRFRHLAIALLGAVYLGYFFPHWVLLFQLPNGRGWVFWVLCVVMVGDTVAYFIGRHFGRRKLAAELSPGKTIAGAWGYIVGAVVAGVGGGALLALSIHWAEIVALSLALSVLAQIGDLFESWIKRVFNVKDSGRLLPGHGGLLDRIDSLVFPAVFTTAYLRVFHP
ncbi:MAG TPA: phosphatidate cytidylyltransferase [Candidatus Binatia bacterium]